MMDILSSKKIPDISFYQGAIDWDKMASQTDAVIIRAGQNLWVDSQFIRNWSETRKRKIYRGSYWFYDDRVSPGEQADLWVNLLKDDLPEMELWCDWEKSYSGGFKGLKNVVAFMERMESYGFTIGLYTGYYWFVENSNMITNASQYSYLKSHLLWLAWYTKDFSDVLVPKIWPRDKVYLWQYGTPILGKQYGCQSQEIDMNLINLANNDEFYKKYTIGVIMANYTGKCLTTAKVWSSIGGARVYPDVTIGTAIKADSKQGEYLHLTSPVVGWSKAVWYQYAEETTPPPPPPTGPTKTHGIDIFSDGKISVDGSAPF